MQNYKPSDFAKLGQPYCSIWGKTEIEILAWSYVTALANDGDIWGRKLTPQEAYDLLTQEQRDFADPFLSMSNGGRFAGWWQDILKQIDSAEGAFEVGGISWNEYQIEKIRKRRPEKK